MNAVRKLPDAEYELMQIIWANEPPISTLAVFQQQGPDKKLKIQSVMTLLLRLIDKNYLRTEKRGKDRIYYPLISRETYVRFETERFVKRFYDDSGANLAAALYRLQKLSKADLARLAKWIDETENGAS